MGVDYENYQFAPGLPSGRENTEKHQDWPQQNGKLKHVLASWKMKGWTILTKGP